MRKIPILWRACLLSRLAELRANAGLRLATAVTGLAFIAVLVATPGALNLLGATADVPWTVGVLVALLTLLWPLGANEPAYDRPLEVIVDAPYGALWLGENLMRLLYLLSSAWALVLTGLSRDASGQAIALGVGFGAVGLAFGGAGMGRRWIWRQPTVPPLLAPLVVGLIVGALTAGLAGWLSSAPILWTGLMVTAGAGGLFVGMATWQPTSQARSAAGLPVLLHYAPRGERLVALAQLEALRVVRTPWFWIFLGSVVFTGVGPSLLCAGPSAWCAGESTQAQGLPVGAAPSLLMLASAAPGIAAATRGPTWPETVAGGQRRARQARWLGGLLLCVVVCFPLTALALGAAHGVRAVPLFVCGLLLTTLVSHDVSERLTPSRSLFLNLLIPIVTVGLPGAFVALLAVALTQVLGWGSPLLGLATLTGAYSVWSVRRVWGRDVPAPETVSDSSP